MAASPSAAPEVSLAPIGDARNESRPQWPNRPTSRAHPLSMRRASMHWALGLALLLTIAGGAQNSTRGTLQQSIGQRSLSPQNDPAEGDVFQKTKQLRDLHAMRQKSIVADTNKLLRLARELDEEIARTGPDSLSPFQLRKLAEIEKLAHNVKDKMSYPEQGAPSYLHPFTPPLIVR